MVITQENLSPSDLRQSGRLSYLGREFGPDLTGLFLYYSNSSQNGKECWCIVTSWVNVPKPGLGNEKKMGNAFKF
jgi:hypothetical protein